MKYFFSVLSFIVLSAFSNADNLTEKDKKRLFDQANNLINNQDYMSAANVLLQLDSIEPGNANINFKIGFCFFNYGSEQSINNSIRYFEKSIKNISEKYSENKITEINAPPMALYYLAKAYHNNYQFSEAIKTFETFKSFIPNQNQDFNDEIARYIKMAQHGLKYMAEPLKMEIRNLGPNINTKYSEYAPVISADESVLIFTSRRPKNENDPKADDGDYYEDIYISYKKDNGDWEVPKLISPNINTPGHEASIGLSVDGQVLFLYKSEGTGGNIYSSRLNGTEWTDPVKLSDNINSKDWEPSASISSDGNLLYFTSDRKGGYGGRDIYMCKKLPNGEWGLPINLGPTINTPFDEDAPFIHPDGRTLFFSSNGHTTMGGFDVFFSAQDEAGKWQTPVNLGYPVNTTQDDIFYVLSADGKKAYYSSTQENGFGKKDIYVAIFEEQIGTGLALIKGKIIDTHGDIPDAQIFVTDLESGEVVGIYRPNARTGNFLFILPPGANYTVSYEAEGYHIQEDDVNLPPDMTYYELNKIVVLTPSEEREVNQNALYFSSAKNTLDKAAISELEKLYQYMIDNPEAILVLSGHTDHTESANNLKLSEERAKAVADYLISKKIDPERIKLVGYGKDKPKVSNTNPDGSNNEQLMQLNRRVEFSFYDPNSVADMKNLTEMGLIAEKPKKEIVHTSVKDLPAEEGQRLMIFNNVLFGFDKFALKNSSFPILKDIYNWLVDNPNVQIEISGHTDFLGDDAYNQQLSEARANAVANYLKSKGIDRSRMVVKGYGKTMPVVSNKLPNGRNDLVGMSKNRRVEFKVLKNK
jgi:outer membrane protein OmpA-like peptidoglycan-associated protein